MTSCRAVNLAGRNTISSAALKDLFVGAGASDVRVLLQSGNAVFQSTRRSTSQLEESIAASEVDLDRETLAEIEAVQLRFPNPAP